MVVLVLAAVAWTLRRPRGEPPAETGASGSTGAAKGETRTSGVVLKSFKEGEQSWGLEAESMVAKEGA